METIQNAAKEALEYMTIKYRRNSDSNSEDNSYIDYKDTAPKWVQDLCREAHLGEMPNDWVFGVIHSALETYADYDDPDDIDILPDMYTADLTGWLHENVSRVGYLTDALQTFGGGLDGFTLLSWAQYLHKTSIYATVQTALEDRID
jgi:hypothetical protein